MIFDGIFFSRSAAQGNPWGSPFTAPGLPTGSMFCPGSEPSPQVASAGAAFTMERPAEIAAAWREGFDYHYNCFPLRGYNGDYIGNTSGFV